MRATTPFNRIPMFGSPVIAPPKPKTPTQPQQPETPVEPVKPSRSPFSPPTQEPPPVTCPKIAPDRKINTCFA